MYPGFYKKLHRISGILLAGFFFFHVINHLFAIGGPVLHKEVMILFRKVYRFPPVEVLLLLSVIVQVISGPVLVWKNRFRRDLFDVLQAGSGLYMAFFLIYHVRAVMLGRYIWHVDTDFHFAAWGVNHAPEKFFFIPYYALSLLSAFIHIACVHRRKMMERNLITASSGRAYGKILQQTATVALVGMIVTVCIMINLVDNEA